jgi:uncharacterized membrane protein
MNGRSNERGPILSAATFDDEDRVPRAWDSLYVSLVPLPAALLGAALLGDVLYWVTATSLYARASEWLLAAGLATGALSAAEGLVRYVAAGRIRPSRASWMHVIGNVLALLLTASNLAYRLNQDAARAVVPAGITLTAIVVCLLIATACAERGLVAHPTIDDRDEWDLL